MKKTQSGFGFHFLQLYYFPNESPYLKYQLPINNSNDIITVLKVYNWTKPKVG